MRLNRNLGILMLLLVSGIVSATSTRQLMDVGVASKDNATTLTIRANGSFQHTEYRPTDNLLLVDLTGVSAAKLENRTQDLRGKFPGVSSYHVVGYKGANGASITRVEMALAPDAMVSVRESGNALALRVTSSAAQAAVTTPAEEKAEPATAPAPVAKANGRRVQVRNVSLSRGKDGFHVEIAASGPVTPKVMKLTSPDRIVIDIPNSVPATKREIAVNNGEIKSIRMARYSLNPPATRVVVDLVSAHEYEMAAAGSHLTLKLHEGTMAAAAPVKNEQQAPQAIAQNAPAVEAIAAPAATSEPVIEQPSVKAPEPTPSERAAKAASHF